VARFPVSDHCNGERFFNPYALAGRSMREVAEWMRTRERVAWPAAVALTPHSPPPARVDPGHVAATFIGHSTFLLRTATTVFITDPVFTANAGPFGRLGPRRVRPPAIALGDLPRVDVVLLSHNHYDHLQPSSIAAIGGDVVTALGVGRHLRGVTGIRPEHGDVPPEGGNDRPGRDPGASAFRRNLRELDWWQSAEIHGATITAVPAQHFSARTPWDRNATLWCGFVVQVDGVTFYFAGDTGYMPQFAEIGDRCPRIDVALLPIGAYEPRWFMAPIHMNPDEAVRAHLDLGARASVGMHFGTFRLTDEGIDEPVRALERARTAYDVSADAFRVLDFGETCIIAADAHRETLRHEGH
jgi:L-ascorbate metabolism protein UlaG (beta-lactamase superfamily)